MAFQFHKIPGFAGLANRRDARNIGNGLSKAQNISLDVGGMIRTIGGLEDFTKVDGTTALTQTAKLCPGASLFTYGSDHWRGTDTIVDLLAVSAATDSAVSDEYGEVDDVGGWDTSAGVSLSSVADTDGGAIASNGTSYIFKLTLTAPGNKYISQSFTTIIGQQYVVSAALYNKTATSTFLVVVDAGIEKTLYYSEQHTAASWTEYTGEFVALGISTTILIYIFGGDTEITYADDAYVTLAPRRDLDTNWLALLDSANAQVDLYNINDDSFTAGLLDFGTVSSFVGVADKINFPTTKTITDANSEFINKGIQAGDIRIISGCTTQTANNIMFVVEHVSAGTIRARGNPFTVAADEDGTVTLTKYNPVAFHYVNEALRASPANGGIALRPKHYSFADRIHFEGADSSERKWSNWYANDVGPVAPTDVAFDAAVDSGLSGNLTAGAGWEVGMTVTADDGEWPAGTYILACFFTYDDGQMSPLYVPSTDVTMTAVTEGASLTLCAKADTATNYDERISGGGVCCRLDETDDPWILLMDISMKEGARATLSGTYNAWAEGATADDVYTASFVSKRPNIDSYESLAGIDPTTPVEVFNGDNAFWNTSVIARNRCFIGSVRYTAEGGALAHFRDRILYSTAGAYDTFPIDNYIDVVQGDAEDYVKLGAYGNDLLCFKHRTLYIVDISDPDDAGWQMKQDANKGKYPRRGIRHPGAYFETPHGPAWCNEFGVFLYTGNEIIELLKDRIELSEHPLAYQRYMEFDGTNDKVTVADDNNLSFGDGSSDSACSFEAIFYMDEATNFYLANKDETSKREWTMGMSGADKIIMYFFDDDASANINTISDAALVAGQWYHVIATYDGGSVNSGINIYVDGALVASTDGSGGTYVAMENLTAPLDIGRAYTNYSDGNIALVRIWSGELSAANVASLYAGAPSSSISGKTVNAEYLPKSIGDATWSDTSGNSLDGTVSGATAIKEDSWASFYTDYSILGYHALTNQLIIMRDCTGKWSSGQDYGDCMIIDLDTGAITTGRRIFTKGIAYSNWCTDWNQDLIIAEQTSSTSVTIKKWTDEPQSQAARLIDIRTADIDFGNPAYAKFFDALVAYYKSSAAQTAPFSYALDGDDRHTAWTRLTGNFAAEGFWEKLTLEPTAFECDTIRFKIDAPTNAGTLEINDLTLRYSTEEEDID